MFKRIRTGLLCMVLAAASTVAIAQSFTTFVNARVITQLDLTGTLTANGSTGTAGQALTSNGAGDVTWSSIGGIPGGINTQVQYNDGGVFGGDAGLTFDEANDRLTMGFGTITGARTNASAPLLLNSTTMAVRWAESDAATDNALWEWAVNAEQIRLGLLDNSGVLGGSAILVDRTGTVVDSVSMQGILFVQGSRFELESTAPLWQGDETDAPANERSWLSRQVAGDWFLSTATDASPQAAVANAFAISRTGTTIDSIALAGTAITLNGVAASDFARLSQSNTFTGQTQLVSHTSPQWNLIETDAPADEQPWFTRATGGDLRSYAALDATPTSTAGATNYQTVTRTGVTVDSIAFASTALTWNANTLFTTANDGSGSLLDSDFLDGLSSAAFAQLAATNTFTGNMLISKDDPQFNTVDTTGPGADEGRWSVLNQSGVWTLRTRTDADGAGNNAIAIGRTGTTVGTIALTGSSVTLNGVASSDFARLSQSNTFTGNTQQITNTSGPRVVVRDSDATADQQCFFMLSQSGQFDLYAATDANCTSTTGGESMFQVTKAGAAIDEVRHPNGTLRINTDHSPAFVVGPTVANITSRSNTTGVVAAAQVNGSAATEATQSLTRANGANSAGPILFLNKSRGTISAPTTVVASGDDIGRIVFSGSDSANFSNGAEISAQVDGTPGAGDMPGRLLFSTTPDGATLPAERMRIDAAGQTRFITAGDPTTLSTVAMTSTRPVSELNETDGAADNRRWLWQANGESLFWSVYNDAGSASTHFLTVNRTGTTVDSFAVIATNASFSGTTTHTGQATFNDGIHITTGGGVVEESCNITLASGTVNNLDIFAGCSPTGPHAIVRVTPDAAVNTTLTGVVLPNNQKVHIVIVDPGSGLVGVIFSGENASSTATNRFVNPNQSAQCTLNRGDSLILWKDPTTDRVRVMNGDGYTCGA